MYSVIWINWYGRKQERQLEFSLNSFQRKADGQVRASHTYAEIEKVEWQEQGIFVVHLRNGSQEHYQSTRQVREIVAVFQRHCQVQELKPKA